MMKQIRRVFLIVAVFTTALVDQGASAHLKLSSDFSGVPCFSQLQQTVSQWNVSADWKQQPPDPEHSVVYASPTNRIGEWVFIGKTKSGTLKASRVTDSEKMNVAWSESGCKAEIHLSHRPPQRVQVKNSFTDEDLRVLVGKNPKGIIYTWAPEMHFSREGLPLIQRVAKNLGIPVTVLVAPHVESAEYKRLRSFDLGMRGMMIQYPSVIVYSNGKISSPAFPGADSEEGYTRFIQRYL
jgi:hypothetical protein